MGACGPSERGWGPASINEWGAVRGESGGAHEHIVFAAVFFLSRALRF